MTSKMRVLASLAAVLVCTACSTVPAQTTAPSPSVRSTVTCNSAGAPCVAKVLLNAGSHSATVDPTEIRLQKGHQVRIFWQLPESCVFLTPFGDGVLVKNLNQVDLAATQFDEQSAVENMNSRKRAQISDLFYWFARNSKKSEGAGIEYKVVFHCKTANGYDPTPYVADPTIFNDGP